MTNPLVATPQSSTTPYSGAPLLESAADLKSAIESGDWASAALGAVGAGMDVLGAAMDPFGTILANGVGWLIEHVDPLKEALDALAGDPDQISAHAETWSNVGAELGAISEELAAMAAADTTNWQGEAADAYRERAENTANLIAASQQAAEGASSGVETAGEVVAAVRGLVRDIIAELVGRLISWALQVLATLGIGMVWVVPQVVRAVASTATKIADVTGKVVKALGDLVPLLKRAGDVFDDASGALRKIDAGPNPKSKALDDLPTTPSSAGGGRGSGGDTAPSGTGGGGRDVAPPPRHDGPDSATSASGTGGGTPRGPGGNTGPSSTTERPPIKDRGNPSAHDTPIKDRSFCGDPVDVATGWMVLTQDDVEFAGALPLVVSRTHISAYRYGRLFGASWASTLDQRLEVEPDGLHLALDDGLLLTFPVPEGSSVVRSAGGPRLSLWRDADDGYVVGERSTGRLLFFGPGPGDTLPLRGIGDGDGNRVEIDYGDAGVPVELRHSGGYRLLVESNGGLVTALRLPGGFALAEYRYDPRGRLVEVIDAQGTPTRFTYDADGRIIRWEDVNGRWYRYGFDAAGRCVRAEGADGFLDATLEYDEADRTTLVTDSLGGVTRYRIDERLRVVATTDPLGGTSTVDLDRDGRVVGRTDALGRTTTYELDEAGDVVRVTRPDGGTAVARYNERGQPVMMAGPDGAVWHNEYDPRGKLLRSIDPMGAATEYRYDQAGNIASVTDPLGSVTRYEYTVAGLPSAVMDPLGAVTRYEYDGFGRTRTVIDPQGAQTRMRWGADGELRRRTDPDGATWAWTSQARGNTDEAVDARGLRTRTEYGHFDLPIADVGPDGERLTYAYDTELRLVAVTNEQGLVWRYAYDPAGNLASETDFNGRTTNYGYDAAGQLVLMGRSTGETVVLQRDVLGRITSRRAGDDVAAFTYDAADRMVSARNADAEVVFTYDALGRVLTESVNGRVVRSDYDEAGRRTARRTPSGAESFFGYDAAGRPTVLRTGDRELSFVYDQSGREVSRRLGSGGSELRQRWDHNDRLVGQTVLSGDHVTQRRAYAYLSDGHLAAVTDAISGPRALALDPAGRVRTISGEGWREDYAYSPSGAITHAGWPGAQGENVLGPRQYHGTLLTAAGDTVYRHDAHGRTVARQRPGQLWQYHWNSDDRLAGVITPDGSRWEYHYDPLGRRIAKQRVDGAGLVVDRTDFTWDGTALAEEVRGGLAVVWDWEPGGERPIAQTERRLGQGAVDERFHTIVTDLVGSPAELVDEAGTVAWHLHTTLWGKVLGRPGRAYTPLRFPGQYHDPETGLHYNFHRYYDPEMGRYLSHDPLGLEPAPDSLAYVGNPTAWIDPLGLARVTPCRKSGAGAKKPRKQRQRTPKPQVPKPAGPKPPRQSYAAGTHGAKTREQNRLTSLFQNEVQGFPGQKVSGKSHESEHPIGYDVLAHDAKDKNDPNTKRGEGMQQKLLENHAPAYQESEKMHADHIGTGNKTQTTHAGFTGSTYRDHQGNALRQDDPNTAIQLNQLAYAHQDGFKADSAELKVADNSYHNMVDKWEGKGITYATGPGQNHTTSPLDAVDAKELHASREAARTGLWPGHHKSGPEEYAAWERGNWEKPIYDSGPGSDAMDLS